LEVVGTESSVSIQPSHDLHFTVNGQNVGLEEIQGQIGALSIEQNAAVIAFKPDEGDVIFDGDRTATTKAIGVMSTCSLVHTSVIVVEVMIAVINGVSVNTVLLVADVLVGWEINANVERRRGGRYG
jgi:hypothetical protein